MSDTTVTLVLEGDEATMSELSRHATASGIQSSLRELKGHAGDVATWVTVIQAATPLIVAFIPYLIERAKRGKITKVTRGDWSVEGTLTVADLKRLRELITHGDRS
jgi:hypothetical protein